MQCQNCDQPILGYGKIYCGSSCAQTVNNKKRPKKFHGACGVCGGPVKSKINKFCSYACMGTAHKRRPKLPKITVESKVCLGCSENRLASEYSPHNTARDSLQPRCKSCRTTETVTRHRQLVEKLGDKAPEYMRTQSLKRYYGMTHEAYLEMIKAQEGNCLICGKPPVKFVVDHSHDTGKVRGLLCSKCNLGIGHFEDLPSRLREAADYLERTS